jgi:nucleoside-diphosphate-sugar epimerase
MLIVRGHFIVGYDVNYYGEYDLLSRVPPNVQIIKDIRDVCSDDLDGFDAVIHLAALSNDPLGELAPGLTEDINLGATTKLAGLAKHKGVSRFIYASSQSMYGKADTAHELTEDEAGPYGVTSYARTKWDAEVQLKRLNDDGFVVVCLRPSTVFGASPNFRCDIVFNNLVASAYTTGKIEIKSDGTPWRPVVHVRDVSSAFIAALEAPAFLVAGESFNVGIPNGNYTVKMLAESAQHAVSGSVLTFTGEHGSDSRTYRISFGKILSTLSDYYQPQWNLDKGGKELVSFFREIGLNEKQFRGPEVNRLKAITKLLEEQRLLSDLRPR